MSLIFHGFPLPRSQGDQITRDNCGGRGGLKEPPRPKWFVTASLPLSGGCVWEQVTSYCVPLIKLKDGWMDGWMAVAPSPPPSTSADEEPSLLCSFLITERRRALAGDCESEPAAAPEKTGQEVRRGGGLGCRKEWEVNEETSRRGLC